MVGELIKEYLVGLGVKIDKPGFAEFDSTINKTSSTISAATGGWAKNFVTASGIIATAMASATASVVGLMTAAAKQDLAMEKYARQMLVSKGAALEMKAAIDALGESVQDIQITPELYNRYKALVGDGRKMKVGGDYEGTMKGFRDLIFEFTRLKQEASYAMQWVGYYLMKYLSRPLSEAKASFKSFNDSMIKNMPVWTEKIAWALVYIINVGRHFWDLLKSIGKMIYDVWDAFPRGIKIATAALAAFFVVLRASPLGRMIALISSLLLLADDYFGYTEGKQAAMGSVWDKLNGYIDTTKRKMTEWGREIAPVWDSFVDYLVMVKDGAINLSEKISEWIEEVQNSKGLRDFVDTVKRLGKALQNLGGGIIDFVADSCKDLMDSMEKNDSAKSFTDLMGELWEIFLGLVDTISDCCQVIGDWLREAGKSEIVRDLVDAIVEMFGAVMDVIGALVELCDVALQEFWGGMGKTQPVYSFRDAVKAVVKMITAMIRGVSKLIKGLSGLFKMMSDNSIFKSFWKGLGEVTGVFFDIVMKALGAVGRLGQALMALVRGDWKGAKRLAGAAVDALFGSGKAEAGEREFKFGEKSPTGVLSAPYESKGDPGAYGWDSTGGHSYGSYQIAQGTMPDFLDFLGDRNEGYRNALESAGQIGSDEFTSEWQRIARIDPGGFEKIQKEYIASTHYQPQLEALADMGIDLEKRSKTLKEVVWSMAVQMRNLTPKIFERALDGRLIDEVSDEELIPALYDIRKDYFWSSTASERQAVWNRYDNDEMPAAIEMLQAEREYEERKKKEQSNDGKYQFINKDGEPPQYQLRNPPADMREPTWWDYTKESTLNGVEELGNNIIGLGNWLWDKAGELGGAILGTSTDGNETLSAHLQNTAAGVDPVMLNRLMGGAASAYSQSYGGTDIKNVSYQIKVGDVIVSKTDASPQDIGQAVADQTITRLQSNVEQVALNRTFGPA